MILGGWSATRNNPIERRSELGINVHGKRRYRKLHRTCRKPDFAGINVQPVCSKAASSSARSLIWLSTEANFSRAWSFMVGEVCESLTIERRRISSSCHKAIRDWMFVISAFMATE